MVQFSAYHHWDGYPEWLGVTQRNTTIQRKIAKLLMVVICHHAILIMSMIEESKSL